MALVIPDDEYKAAALSSITRAITHAGRFEYALELAQTTPVELDRAQALSGIAIASAETGQSDRVLQAYASIPKLQKAPALYAIAMTFVRVGQIEPALLLAQLFPNDISKSRALPD